MYSHVVSTVKYDKTGKGWGRGDIYYACDARRGNCTDFHAIFIGYCRALGMMGRDIVVSPRQKGDPLNYFAYPYAEVDGNAFSGTEFLITYRDE